MVKSKLDHQVSVFRERQGGRYVLMHSIESRLEEVRFRYGFQNSNLVFKLAMADICIRARKRTFIHICSVYQSGSEYV